MLPTVPCTKKIGRLWRIGNRELLLSRVSKNQKVPSCVNRWCYKYLKFGHGLTVYLRSHIGSNTEKVRAVFDLARVSSCIVVLLTLIPAANTSESRHRLEFRTMFRRKNNASLPTTILPASSGGSSPSFLRRQSGADGSGKSIKMDAPIVKAWKQANSFTKYSYYFLAFFILLMFTGYRYLRYWNGELQD